MPKYIKCTPDGCNGFTNPLGDFGEIGIAMDRLEPGKIVFGYHTGTVIGEKWFTLCWSDLSLLIPDVDVWLLPSDTGILADFFCDDYPEQFALKVVEMTEKEYEDLGDFNGP